MINQNIKRDRKIMFGVFDSSTYFDLQRKKEIFLISLQHAKKYNFSSDK